MVGILLAAAILLPGATPGVCDLDCQQRTAEELIEEGEIRAAVEGLKRARERYPHDRRLTLLLARAYLFENNLFWAERTLHEAVARWPDDLELRTWLAAVHFRQGDPDLMRDDLRPDLQPTEDPLRARWNLLVASQARLSEDLRGAERALAEVDRRSTLFPEDLGLWAFLQASSDPWWSPSITGNLDLGIGRTSNALAGSPTDPGEEGEPSSLGLIDFRGSLVPSTRASVRPAFDLMIIANGLGNEAYRDLSTLLAGVRMGAVVSSDNRRMLFGYRAEALFLNQDDALYSEAHRGEFEIEWRAGSVLFGGGGRRSYRDSRRTRWEADAGFGGPLGRLGPAPVVGGATVLVAEAESPAYDQLGLSAALSARRTIVGTTVLGVALSGVWDDYFNSGGEEGELVFGTEEKRKDLLARAVLTVWTPPWKRLQPRCELSYTRRWSTADTKPGFDFSFREWRIEAWLRWNFAAEPWGPKTARSEEHIPLDWRLEAERGMHEERILDLLRRDEELRRGSSCGLK
jgi:hypothetical protein